MPNAQRSEKIMERIAVSAWLVGVLGFACMIATGVIGGYPSPIYFYFGIVMSCGLAVAFVTLIALFSRYIWRNL